jgi:heme a synthase
VQFVHRTAAYMLWIVAMVHAVDATRTARGGETLSVVLAGAVTLQAAIGIWTLLHQAPIGLALLHQGMAVAVLAIAVIHAERLTANRTISQ